MALSDARRVYKEGGLGPNTLDVLKELDLAQEQCESIDALILAVQKQHANIERLRNKLNDPLNKLGPERSFDQAKALYAESAHAEHHVDHFVVAEKRFAEEDPSVRLLPALRVLEATRVRDEPELGHNPHSPHNLFITLTTLIPSQVCW